MGLIKLYHSFRTAGLLWNASNTLLGLLASLGGRRAWDNDNNICEVVGGWFIRFLDGRGWAVAITLGDVVLFRDASVQAEWRSHEYVHVCQGRRWGPFFLPAYFVESLYQWLRTGDGYRSNRFERQAYKN